MAELMNLRTFLRGGYRADREVTVISRTQVLGTWTPAEKEAMREVEIRPDNTALLALERAVAAPVPEVLAPRKADVSMGAPRTFSPAPKPSQRGKK